MAFKDQNVKDIYLLTTEVENLFINEFMLDCPGDYVKVYLYALFSSKYQKDVTIEKIANILNLDLYVVKEAFTFFENAGIIRKTENNGETDIEFISQRDILYGHIENHEDVEEKKEDTSNLIKQDIKELFNSIERMLNRTLSQKELTDIVYLSEQLGIEADVIKFGVSYSIERGKNNFQYISKVLENWNRAGLNTLEDIKASLGDYSERQGIYKRILSSLGLMRNPTEAERELIDSWIDKMGYNMDRIMEACARTISTANPSLRYVNKVLENWKGEAEKLGVDINKKVTITNASVYEYYRFLKESEENEAKARKAEIYKNIPIIKELDNEKNQLMAQFTRDLINRDQNFNREKTKLRIKDIDVERAYLLTENNYPIDYTEVKYKCDVCKDTGKDDNGAKCSCFKIRFGEAELWQEKRKSQK